MIYELELKSGSIVKVILNDRQQIGDAISNLIDDKYEVTEEIKEKALEDFRQEAKKLQ